VAAAGAFERNLKQEQSNEIFEKVALQNQTP
jgi:hypothetical protein